MSRLKLVTIASDLKSITLKNISDVVASDYSHYLLRSSLYGETTSEATLGMLYNSPQQQDLFSVSGLAWDFPASDGVHLMTLHLGKTVPNGFISSTGVLSFTAAPSLTGIKWVSLLSDPYTLYKLSGSTLAGAPEVDDESLIIWDESDESILILISTEKAWAEQVRIRATYGQCQDFPVKLLGDIISAELKYLCGDYKGANLMIDNILKSCGCA